jgi:pimeloyl-ACP methyl ester carboxylesterase
MAGTGEPALIFVHGLGCAMADWNGQIEALSRKFCCIALDLPGHGASPVDAAPDLVQLGAAVTEAKFRCGADKVVLVGHSLGGKVIREAYRQSPAQVAGLVFVDASLYAGDHAAIARDTAAAIAREGLDAFLLRLFSQMFVDSTDPALRERLLHRALAADSTIIEALIFEQIRWEAEIGEAALRRIAVPVLALQATRFDAGFRRVPLRPGMTTPFTDALARLGLDAEVKLLTGVGHFAMIEAAAAVNEAIGEFVDGLGRRGARAS